jgi:hypothetical protein
MGEQRRRWSADHRWQHPGGFCKRAGGAAVRDPSARSMEDARAACSGQLAVPLFLPHRGVSSHRDMVTFAVLNWKNCAEDL